MSHAILEELGSMSQKLPPEHCRLIGLLRTCLASAFQNNERDPLARLLHVDNLRESPNPNGFLDSGLLRKKDMQMQRTSKEIPVLGGPTMPVSFFGAWIRCPREETQGVKVRGGTSHIRSARYLNCLTQNHVRKYNGGRSYLLGLSLTNTHLPGF